MNKSLRSAELMALEVSARSLGQILRANQKTIERYASGGVAVRVGHGRYRLAQSVSNVVKRLREQAAGRVGHDESVNVVGANARFITISLLSRLLRSPLYNQRGGLRPISLGVKWRLRC